MAPKTEVIEQLRARIAELEEENARLKAESRDASLGLNDYYGMKLAARVRELEEENARLRTVPMKYRRMQFNAQLQDENKELRAQLVAAQEEIERLNGQISVYRLSFVELERQRDVEMTSATRWATGYHELRDQLAKAEH